MNFIFSLMNSHTTFGQCIHAVTREKKTHYQERAIWKKDIPEKICQAPSLKLEINLLKANWLVTYHFNETF